jgi:hypothetical protein
MISVFVFLLNVAISHLSNSSSLQITNIGVIALFLCCFDIFVPPVLFYLDNGITFVSALIFGGKGNFVSQAYLESLFVVPLGLISSITSFALLIPVIGNYVLYGLVFVIAIFNLVYVVRTFKVVHGFTTTRAIIAVVSPIFLLVIIPICVIGTLIIMGPAIGNAFSTINASLATPVP